MYKNLKVQRGRVIPTADGTWMCELIMTKVLPIDDLKGQLREELEMAKCDLIGYIEWLQK